MIYNEWGSPPRMRGKDGYAVDPETGERITPAYAGKRVSLRTVLLRSWDHPRVCGEKARAYAMIYNEWGSPPRMRGKVHVRPTRSLQRGITPAYAGKRN